MKTAWAATRRWISVGCASIAVLGADSCRCFLFDDDTSALTGVPDTRPKPLILVPTEGATFTTADTVHLRANLHQSATSPTARWRATSVSGRSTYPADSIAFDRRAFLPGSLRAGTYDLRAIATFRLPSDAPYTSEDTVRITVTPGPNQAPVVAIAWPTDGTEWPADSTLRFRGSASDLEDGVLFGPALVWSSSIDGVLGTGSTLPHAGVSAGDHTITLTATDAAGASSVATATLHALGPVTTIRGTVTIGGQGRDQVTMELSGPESRFTSTLGGGQFLFADIPPGDYVVRVHPPAGTTFPNVTQSVSVAFGQVAVVNFAGS